MSKITGEDTVSSSPAADSYRRDHEQRPPKSGLIKNDDEKVQLGDEQGLLDFPLPDFPDPLPGSPPRGTALGENTYLWAIEQDRVPVILEDCEMCGSLESGRAKHTNLTGGGQAYCGGEIWFESGSALFLSGGSGRYTPRSKEELEEVVEIFRSCGYRVTSLGWDEETAGPSRLLRG